MSPYQKQIHDYLSGELSREQEEKLFDGLSQNAEWREEMQFQLRLERTMEQDPRFHCSAARHIECSVRIARFPASLGMV